MRFQTGVWERETCLKMKQKQLDGRQQVMRDFAEVAANRGQHFFYVLIREPLAPSGRIDKYEAPLSAALGELGKITGGGSQLGEGATIAYCGIDVVVVDRDLGLQIIRKSLRACGAGDDTVIEENVPNYRALTL